MFLEAAAMCLAINVFHEARGEPLAGQYAVALVTMNRAQGHIGKVCDVVYKPMQFSWTIGLPGRVKQKEFERALTKPQRESWARSVTVAMEVLRGKMPDFTGGATHYHRIDAKPGWRKRLVKLSQFGAHIFYRHS